MERGMRFRIVTAAVLLVFLFFGTAHADQEIYVSKGVKGFNIIPRVAVHTERGDIMVVWTNQEPGTTNLKVYARWLKQKKNGKYKMKKARLISSSDGWNANAQVVFVPWKNQYFVFWDTYNYFNGLVSGEILGRRVNKRGKGKGPIKTLVSDSRSNNWPRAIVSEESLQSLDIAPEDRRIVLTWSAFPTSFDDQEGGIRVLHLNENMDVVGGSALLEQTRLLPSSAFDGVKSSPTTLENRAFTSDARYSSNYGLSISTELGGGNWKANFQYYDSESETAEQGNVGNRFEYEDRGRPRVFLSPRRDGTIYGVAVRRVQGTNQVEVRRFVLVPDPTQMQIPSLNYAGDGFKGKPGANDSTSIKGEDMVRLNLGYNSYLNRFSTGVSSPALKDIEVAAWIYSDEDSIYWQPVTVLNDGKLQFGDAEEVAGHDGELSWLEATDIPGTDEFAIAWSRNVSGSSKEIHVTIVN